MKRYETIAAFEAALRTKLHALATKERTFQALRKQVAFDRVLARLQTAAPESWLLKGGLALEYRIARARATLDIDITTELDLNEMSKVLARAAALDLDDYFQIIVGERERPVDEMETYRFHIAVQYSNGRTFENIKLDIGFADPWLGAPLSVQIPSLLDFAGIKATTVRMIPREQHLAEKIHAYTKAYGSRPSSRVKDLIDMALLIKEGVDLDPLGPILRKVFETRRTHDMPTELPPPPSAWRVPYERLALGLPIPPDLDGGYKFVADGLAGALERS